MGQFEYFIIFVAILIGLAVEGVLRNLDRLLEAGKRVRWDWMAPALAINAIIFVLSQFWLTWQLREHYRVGSFLDILPIVTSLSMVYLVASATLPSRVPEEGLDLREWYFENRKRYWGLVLAMSAAFIFANLMSLLMHAFPAPVVAIFIAESIAVGALSVSLIRSRNAWWHSVCIVLVIAMNLINDAGLQLS